MGITSSVCMVWQDAKSDGKRSVRCLAHEERTEMIQEWAAAEQRLETGRGIGVGHTQRSAIGQTYLV
jgi:hypothetical protein